MERLRARIRQAANVARGQFPDRCDKKRQRSGFRKLRGIKSNSARRSIKDCIEAWNQGAVTSDVILQSRAMAHNLVAPFGRGVVFGGTMD